MIVLSLMISSVEEHDLKVCEPNLFLLFLSVSRYLPQWIAQDELSETRTPYYTLVLLLEAPA